MKKLWMRIVCLSLAQLMTMGPVAIASSEQICHVASRSNKPVNTITDTSCTKQLVKKPVNDKTNLNQKRCLTAKQCQKLPSPAADKPASLKVPVLFPLMREVAFIGYRALPVDALPTADHTSISHFLAPSS